MECYHDTTDFENSFDDYNDGYILNGKGTETQDDASAGSSGRFGVCGRDGDGEIRLAAEGHHPYLQVHIHRRRKSRP